MKENGGIGVGWGWNSRLEAVGCELASEDIEFNDGGTSGVKEAQDTGYDGYS